MLIIHYLEIEAKDDFCFMVSKICTISVVERIVDHNSNKLQCLKGVILSTADESPSLTAGERKMI